MCSGKKRERLLLDHLIKVVRKAGKSRCRRSMKKKKHVRNGRRGSCASECSVRTETPKIGSIRFVYSSEKMKPLSVVFLLLMVVTLVSVIKISFSREGDDAIDNDAVIIAQKVDSDAAPTETGKDQGKNATSAGKATIVPEDFSKFLVGECPQNAMLDENVKQALLDDIYAGSTAYASIVTPEHLAPFLEKSMIKGWGTGWGSQDKVFEDLIEETKPKVVLEIGTFLGSSIIHMAKLAKSLGLNQTIFIGVDDFRGYPYKFVEWPVKEPPFMLMFYQFLRNVVDANLTEAVVPMPFATSSALRRLCQLGIKVDLVEVDAGHDFHSVWMDINAAWLLLKPETGIMFGHDYFLHEDDHGVRRAVDLFAKVHGLRVAVNGAHWVYRKN